ncbi:MAG: glycosyltransferase family 9 protein [Bdellovibrionales bacterium]|nr:glycosyltransferase family 9 protein [Bdellovibrionales bacterium]
MNIVINRTDAIGDTVLTIPMARVLKLKYPDAKIVFIISPKTQDLFLDNKYVDETWVIDPNLPFFSKVSILYNKFKSFRTDYYLYVGGSQISTFVAWLCRVKFRGGLKSKWKSFLFLNRGVRQSRSMVLMHEFEYNLNLLAPMGIEYNYFDRESTLQDILSVEAATKSDAIKYLQEELKNNNSDVDKDYIVIHPGMVGHTLNWPSRNYGRLISRIRSKFNNKYNIIISYTPSDNKYLEGLKDHLASTSTNTNDVLFLDGSIKGLKNYMGILSQAKLFIGPSTGPTHLANVLGVKMVGLYSPIKVQSATRWGPVNRNLEQSRVVVPDVVCGEVINCIESSCPYYECMSKIEVDEVFSNVSDLLN